MPLYTLNKLPLLVQDIFQKSHIIRHLLKFICEGNVDVQLFEDFKKILKLCIKLSLLSLSGKGTFGACFGAASSFLLGIAIRDANTSFSSCDPLPDLGIAILVSFAPSFSFFFPNRLNSWLLPLFRHLFKLPPITKTYGL